MDGFHLENLKGNEVGNISWGIASQNKRKLHKIKKTSTTFWPSHPPKNCNSFPHHKIWKQKTQPFSEKRQKILNLPKKMLKRGADIRSCHYLSYLNFLIPPKKKPCNFSAASPAASFHLPNLRELASLPTVVNVGSFSIFFKKEFSQASDTPLNSFSISWGDDPPFPLKTGIYLWKHFEKKIESVSRFFVDTNFKKAKH